MRKTAKESTIPTEIMKAFARPEKPDGVDEKHAYIVGSGLAALAAACFLVRDARCRDLIFTF